MNELTLFSEALEITNPSERALYLHHACAGNPTLRVQLDRLIAEHERSGQFLDVPALEQIAAGSPPGRPPISDPGNTELRFLEPTTETWSLGRLKHYEIEAVIGRGGGGVVLKAFDTQLQRVVAIKAINTNQSGETPADKYFLREARATAAIRHENVVGIHAVEEHPFPFLVMEFIDGESLQQKLDRTGKLPVDEIMQIGLQIANGLEAAHQKGLVHRDIKPANILLENGTPHLKVTDFGLAGTSDDLGVTKSGYIAGTPLYMSPEQAQGQKLDHRSDLFSLGSVLYYLGTGRPPFQDSNPWTIMKRVIDHEPDSLQTIAPELPPWLTALIGKLLAKHPDERIQSAGEVGQIFSDQWKQFEQARIAGQADGVPHAHRPFAIAKASRWLTIAGGILLLAILGLTQTSNWSPIRSIAGPYLFPAAEQSAERPVSQASIDRDAKEVPSGDNDDQPSEPSQQSVEPPSNLAESAVVAEEVSLTLDDEPPAEPVDLLPQGSTWLGKRTYLRGAYEGITVHYELHIEKREGNRFKGHVFDNGRGRNYAKVEGTIDGDSFTWKEFSRGNVFTMEGHIANDKLTFQFQGKYHIEGPTEGEGSLSFVR
ncbi:serine/threonine-protein kinase [Blastopirellula marina]|uniref:non-specific serine/threonine protein kinase n=1 Tax=Blastopirellula marina TaxID=124 RepID=A0A2S8GBZ1_9BACT|nr:serine/threonine-protein kinase [Blastopirellula marina]PQO41943.1 hypothetical protein C5Y98_02600 [Blastopirellula marina]PTL46301.1 serine/threonine protein kinase [Blastopirellula marina]